MGLATMDSEQSVRRSARRPRSIPGRTTGACSNMRTDVVPWERHFTRIPHQLEGQVSNGSCLQLADESSARRAGLIKAELSVTKSSGSSLQASQPEPARHPRYGTTGDYRCPSVWVSDSQPVIHLTQIHAKATVPTVTLTQV
ncbi:hypothetical protein Bbelb_314170 [Branchiostoma belcheri]|nr:hypothetical protein Bbelb_314170 [Branchiostoma belcheri]